MNDQLVDDDGSSRLDPDDFDGSFEANRRRQWLLGLELEPVERLRWLERTMAEMRKLVGRAKS